MTDETPSNDLAGKHPPLAASAGAPQTPDSLGGDPGQCGAQHGLRAGAGSGGEDSRDTRPDRATRYVETTQGILSYSELAPLLADRVTAVEAAILGGAYADRPLAEPMVLDIHRAIAGDLVPEWAGQWRVIEVTVGALRPPLPHDVPARMRDYCLDLQARWHGASQTPSELTLELLAFAESRFLSIHPFRDFNGRTIRVLLRELLRRLDFPQVILIPDAEEDRARYFDALESADQMNWGPLIAISTTDSPLRIPSTHDKDHGLPRFFHLLRRRV